jgi:hypothetical protein
MRAQTELSISPTGRRLMKRPKQLPAADRRASKKTAAVPIGATVCPSILLGPWYPTECAGAACPL